jgi:hypothetical protein
MTPIETTGKSAPIDEPLRDRAWLVGVVRRPAHARRPRLGFAHLAVLAWCAVAGARGLLSGVRAEGALRVVVAGVAGDRAGGSHRRTSSERASRHRAC